MSRQTYSKGQEKEGEKKRIKGTETSKYWRNDKYIWEFKHQVSVAETKDKPK